MFDKKFFFNKHCVWFLFWLILPSSCAQSSAFILTYWFGLQAKQWGKLCGVFWDVAWWNLGYRGALGAGIESYVGPWPSVSLSLEAVFSKVNGEMIMISGDLRPDSDFLQISGSQCHVQPWSDFSHIACFYLEIIQKFLFSQKLGLC